MRLPPAADPHTAENTGRSEDTQQRAEDESEQRQGGSSLRTGAASMHKADEARHAGANQPTATQAAQMFVFTAAKAGMKDVDKDHVQKVVFEMSKDSLFFQNSIKQNEKVEARIQDMRDKLKSLTTSKREVLRRQIDARVAKLEATRELTRTKVVVDMDMFYAAVEMRDNPSLRDKPLAVGGIGMLSTTNYVARKFGVRAAMPGFIGKELCPDLVIVPPNFDKYTTIATQIRQIVEQYDPNFRAMSLDEVYCDITDFIEENWSRYCTSSTERDHSDESCGDAEDEDGTEILATTGVCSDPYVGFDRECVERTSDSDLNRAILNRKATQTQSRKRTRAVNNVPAEKREEAASAIVNEIRQRIFETTKLTASAGIAANTMLAKICSDINKPNGQYVLPFSRDDVLSFIEKLPIRKIGGIGKVMEKTLSSALEIATGKDLYDRRVELAHVFSDKTASWLLRISLGMQAPDGEEAHSGRKSYSRERTFSAQGIGDPKTLEKICLELCDKLSTDMAHGAHGAKTVTLKLKCVDFSVRTRAVSTSQTVRSKEDLYGLALELLRKEMPLRLRLMGVKASALVSTDGKLETDFGSRSHHRQALIDNFTKRASATEPLDCFNDLDSKPANRNFEAGSYDEDARQHDQKVDSKRQRRIGPFTADGSLPKQDNIVPRELSPRRSRQRMDFYLSSFANESGNVARADIEFQPCPVCGKLINAGNAIAVDVHVDACLRRPQRGSKRKPLDGFFQAR